MQVLRYGRQGCWLSRVGHHFQTLQLRRDSINSLKVDSQQSQHVQQLFFLQKRASATMEKPGRKSQNKMEDKKRQDKTARVTKVKALKQNMLEKKARLVELKKQKEEGQAHNQDTDMADIDKSIAEEEAEIQKLEKDVEGDIKLMDQEEDEEDNSNKIEEMSANIQPQIKQEENKDKDALKATKRHEDLTEGTDEIANLQKMFQGTSVSGTTAVQASEWKGTVAFRRTRGSQDKDTVDIIGTSENNIWRFTNRSLTAKMKTDLPDLSDPNDKKSLRRIERVTKQERSSMGRPSSLIGVLCNHNFSKEDQLFPLNPSDPMNKWKYEHIELVNPVHYVEGGKYHGKKMPATYVFFIWPDNKSFGVETRSALKMIWPKKGLTPLNSLIYQTLCEREPPILQEELEKPEYEHIRARIKEGKTSDKQQSKASTSPSDIIPKQPQPTPSPNEDMKRGSSEKSEHGPQPGSEKPTQSVEQQQPIAEKPVTEKPVQLSTTPPQKSPNPTPAELVKAKDPVFLGFLRQYAQKREKTLKTLTQTEKTAAFALWKDSSADAEVVLDFD
jgi:hypothetical protein